ncbi:unnamed protein product [Ilex paraguariensis]|uniref:AAA+ ATPase domain-containing protein n=1 Tax=Ilex paraguariensis TaxID=185542 RepID=A0ABC8S4B0_9AQUA
MATGKLPGTKTILSAAASVAASAMLIRSIANEFLPAEFQQYYISTIRSFRNRLSSQFTIVIDEYRGHIKNELFEAADMYLGTITTPSTQRVKLGKTENEKNLAITVDTNVEVVDVFEDVNIQWRLVCIESKGGYETAGAAYGRQMRGGLNTTLRTEIRFYELSFGKKYKEKVINSYLPYILEKGKIIQEEGKVIKLYTVRHQYWDAKTIKIDHPMTFKTLTMDSEIKKALMEDLNNYINGKEFYRRIGKAWKRGYLLYGPPGTGKSSLIAAMANYLNYNIYDLDLTDVMRNSDLRSLLLGMSSRSILVIEDIDCSIKLQNRESEDEYEAHNPKNKVTLSGLLNFIDGLWSCCGSERIIIFTTNHKDRLDPALLRPGRMDMHIHMTYCTFSAFKQLALNYLGLYNHNLLKQIEELLGKVEVTPAEVAGELMKTSNAEVSLQGLVKFLHNKMKEKEEIKTEKNSKAHNEEENENEKTLHAKNMT